MSDSAPPPPPPPPPSGDPYAATGTQAGGQPGTVGPRIGARLVDFIITGIVVTIISSAVGGGGLSYGGNRDYSAYAISGVISAIVYLAYFALMESNRGQTLGKMLFKLRVVGPGGGNPTLAEAIKRNLWVTLNILGVLGVFGNLIGGLVSLIVIILLIVQAANESTGRVTFMDKFAGGTRVVKAG